MATSSKPTRVRVAITCLIAAVAGTAIAACGTSKPKITGTSGLGAVGATGTPSTAPGTTGKPKPTPTPNPTVTVTMTDSSGNPVITLTAIQPTTGHPILTGILILGDYTVSAQGGCAWYMDSNSYLYLTANFKIGYSGVFNPTSVSFQLTNNKDLYRGTNPAEPIGTTFPLTIGGQYYTQSAWRGQKVTLTAMVDYDNQTSESNESNNTASISINVPSSTPPTTPTSLPC